MTQQDWEKYIEGLENVEKEENMGYLFFFYGDYHMVPFATIGMKDNDYDNVSNLNRDGVFRLNLGISKATYDSLIPETNSDRPIDYAALDVFLPHPDYASQFYLCILNPSSEHEEQVKHLISEAHELAKKKDALRAKV